MFEWTNAQAVGGGGVALVGTLSTGGSDGHAGTSAALVRSFAPHSGHSGRKKAESTRCRRKIGFNIAIRRDNSPPPHSLSIGPFEHFSREFMI